MHNTARRLFAIIITLTFASPAWMSAWATDVDKEKTSASKESSKASSSTEKKEKSSYRAPASKASKDFGVDKAVGGGGGGTGTGSGGSSGGGK